MAIIKNFMGVFMVLVLMACFGITAYTLYSKYPEMELSEFTLSQFLNGSMANNFEDEFEDKLLIKDTAVGFWGGINYGLFKTGNQKVVIGQDGWLFTEEEFIKHDNAKAEIEKKLQTIKHVNQFLNAQNIQLIVALIPSKTAIYSEHLGRYKLPNHVMGLYEDAHARLNRNNILTPDIKSIFMREKQSGTQVFLKQDTHWTPMGAVLAANLIASYVDSGMLPKTEFETVVRAENSYDPDLKKYVPTGVFTPWVGLESEQLTQHETTSNADGGGLFDDPVLPVTLVGTSYSAIQNWNFEGALKTALQADVLNVSQEGNGPMKPMADYLSQNNFDNTRLVVWEIPERFLATPYDDVVFPKQIMEGVQ